MTPDGGAPLPDRPHRRPPKRRPGGLIPALAFAALVTAVGGLAAVAGLSSREEARRDMAAAAPDRVHARAAATTPAPGAGRTVRIPESVAGYRRITGGVADRMTENLRRSMKQQNQYGTAYSKAKIAIYAKPGRSEQPLIFVGLPGRDIPELAAELRSRPPSEEVDSIFMGMGVLNAKDYPAGPLGGVLRCGKGASDGNGNAAACVWADGSVVGLVMTPLNSDVPGLARTTLALRNAAEH